MHAERIYDFDEGPLIDGDPDLSLSNSPSENFGVCGHLTSSGLELRGSLKTQLKLCCRKLEASGCIV